MAQVVRVKDEERTGSVPPSPAMRPATEAAEFLRRPVVWVGERVRRTRQFLHEVRVELRHVTWPSRADVRSTTIVVLITVAFFGLYFFLLDFGIAQVVNMVFDRFRP